MRQDVLVWLAISLASAGCLQSSTKTCGDLVCPSTLVCHEDLHACVLPAQLSACEGKAEGDACTYAGASAGTCVTGVCAPQGCGNGEIELGEICDDGNTLSGDDCSSDCRSDEACGNGIVDVAAGEGCDDGNTEPGDSCQPDCAVPTCGDGIVDLVLSEVCDDGNTNAGDGCNSRCTSDETCGNGVVDPVVGEECDDDNAASGDGCYQCRFEICGNNRVDPGEVCDDGDNTNGDGCSANCLSDETCGNGVVDIYAVVPEGCDAGDQNADTPNADCRTNCQRQRCGDGIVDDLFGERCEDGQLGDETCTSVFGYYSGTLSCSTTCGYSAATCTGYCGDGVLQSPQEECDTTVPSDVDCTAYGYYTPEGLSCTNLCSLNSMTCTGGICGDGTRDAGELCDGDDLGGADCTDLGYYEPTTLTCNLGCSFNSTQCQGGRCGDNVLNGTEFCDGKIPTTTCGDFGQDMGRVGCTGFCAPGFFPDCSRREFATQTAPTTSTLRAAWAAAPDDIFAVGDSGTILHYDGLGWAPMASGTTQNLVSVWGTSGTHVYAVGNLGTVRRYDGTQWIPVGVPTTQALTGVHGTSESDIWIAGGNSPNAVIVHWDGTSWTATTGWGFGVSFSDIWTPSPGTAFAVGQGGTIRRYDSGSWSTMTPQTNSSFRAVWGRTATDVYVAGSVNATTPATIQHYDGISWTTQGNFGTDSMIADIFGSADEVYALKVGLTNGSGVEILRRGPLYWEAIDTDPLRLWGGTLTTSGDVVGVGDNGSILKMSVWSRLLTVPAAPLNGAWHDVWASDENEAFFVGAGGAIRRRHFDESTPTGWTSMTSNTTAHLHGVWGASPNRVFAVGSSGTIRLWDGVGPGWITMTTNPATTRTFLDVWGTAADNVYAVASNGSTGGEIYHYDGNASNEWTRVASSGNGLYAIGGSGPSDVYAVGPGNIRRFDGTSWSAVSFGGNLNGVVARGPGDVFAVGDNGLIVRSVDNGATWRPMVSTTFAELSSVDARGPRGDVFAVGFGGELLHFDDERWTEIRPITSFPTYGVAITGNHLFAAGAQVYEMHHTLGSVELCGNEWDDDGDGAHDCADTDCAGSPYCTAGGACTVADMLACGETVAGDNFTGSPFPDNYACLPRHNNGPDAAYRFETAVSGPVTATLSSLSADVDLIVVEEHASGGCDPQACVGASSTSATASEVVTFNAVAGRTYQIVVDGFDNAASTFLLSLSCP